jgi:hypothetical protein
MDLQHPGVYVLKYRYNPETKAPLQLIRKKSPKGKSCLLWKFFKMFLYMTFVHNISLFAITPLNDINTSNKFKGIVSRDGVSTEAFGV